MFGRFLIATTKGIGTVVLIQAAVHFMDAIGRMLVKDADSACVPAPFCPHLSSLFVSFYFLLFFFPLFVSLLSRNRAGTCT